MYVFVRCEKSPLYYLQILEISLFYVRFVHFDEKSSSYYPQILEISSYKKIIINT